MLLSRVVLPGQTRSLKYKVSSEYVRFSRRYVDYHDQRSCSEWRSPLDMIHRTHKIGSILTEPCDYIPAEIEPPKVVQRLIRKKSMSSYYSLDQNYCARRGNPSAKRMTINFSLRVPLEKWSKRGESSLPRIGKERRTISDYRASFH